MSHLLQLLGRGLDSDLSDVLDRYFPPPAEAGLEQLRQRVREKPDDPEARVALGLAYFRGADWDAAIRHFEAAWVRDPNHRLARLALAAAYDEKGNVSEGIDHLEAVCRANGSEAPVLFAAGFCFEKLNQPEPASAYYRLALAQDPTLTRARERLAAACVVQGDLDEAIEQYRALREAQPQEPFFRAALGHLLHRAGRRFEAVEEFETTIAMEPENWALVDDEVEELVAAGKLREAIERLQGLIDQQGDFADLHVRLGDLYSRLEEDDPAMTHYRQALELQPHYLEATVKVGAHHLINDRWEEAAEAFHQAADLNDNLLECYVGMGVAQAADGEQAGAANCFDLAATIEPNSTLLLAEAIKIQLKSVLTDEYAGALSPSGLPVLPDAREVSNWLLHHQTACHAEEVSRHPNHADLRYRYGVLLRAQGKTPEAAEQFLQATRVSPSHVQAVIKLGVARQELGQAAEAAEAFQRAMDVQAQTVDMHYRLGMLYTNRRRFEESVRQMEAASGSADDEQVRASLAMSLQNMGLLDRPAATWRSLWRIHRARAR